MAKKKDEGRLPLPVVRVAPLGELRAFTISEHELDRLSRGTVFSDLLTISYVLLSIAATILVTLLSTSLPQLNFIIFICALLIFTISGGISFIIGWRLRENIQALVSEIKGRMPTPAGIQEQLPMERVNLTEFGFEVGESQVPPRPSQSPEDTTSGDE